MNYQSTPIALIGMALRAPGADTPEAFWDNILAGRDCLTRPTEGQLRRAGVPERLIQSPMFVRSRPMLKNPAAFDPAFFGISSVSARMTDPSHRLFLTCVWEALERAGVIPGPEAGIVGVFAGVGGGRDDYMVRNFGGGAVDMDDPAVWLPVNMGCAPEHITGRICFELDLRGPNITTLAACATSLVAVHLAIRALRHGDCDTALAGGANVAAPDWPGYLYVDSGPVSSSGTVRPFDKRADGTVFGSGVGVVVLKRLEDALADGDYIHSILLGSAIFNDGGDKRSFTAPGVEGQVVAMSRALESAGISAATLGLLEAHGTGTLIGDPIEVEAATQTFHKYTNETQFCALGALKANIGHTRAAAGVLGLIKASMVLERGVFPPHANFESPNPQLDLENSPFYIPTGPTPWHSNGQPRRAGVSAFGFGGNNAHVVLEEAPLQAERKSSDKPSIIVLSARSAKALDKQISNLAKHLDSNADLRSDDIAHTLQFGRKSFDHRAAFVADTRDGLLNSLIGGELLRGSVGLERPVIFAFPGQGSQSPGMGLSFYNDDAEYRSHVDRCADILKSHIELDIRDLLHSNEDGAAERLQQTQFTQPALFVTEYAFSRSLMARGVQPSAMIGHSVSEFVAACLAEVFSLEDALALVAHRGQLMQACEPGAMMALFLSEEEVRSRLSDGLEIAGLNAPEITVVSGSRDAIESLKRKLEEEELDCHLLRTSHGFHSESMAPALQPFREAVSQIQRSKPRIPFISNVTGEFISDAEATDPAYWSQHLRKPVRFSHGVETLQKSEDSIWIEVGPGHALSSLIKRQTSQARVVSDLYDTRGAKNALLGSLSRMWVEGVSLDWEKVAETTTTEQPRKVTLPTYPFEERDFWIDPPLWEPDEDESTPQKRKASDNVQLVPEWLYKRDWQKAELRSPKISAEEGWMIFSDDLGLADKIVEYLIENEVQPVILTPGEKYCSLGDARFQIRPGEIDDIVSVLKECSSTDWMPHRILHLWQYTGSRSENETFELFELCMPSGFDTLIALVRGLEEFGIEHEVDITVAADGLFSLGDHGDSIHWEKASLIGPCRTIPLEFPSFSVQLVDVPGAVEALDQLVLALLAEASSPETGICKVLTRDGRFLEVLRQTETSPAAGRIRPQSVALITGGAGGLGLEVAERLFDMAQMRLALLTRWQPPAEDEWGTRAKQDDKVGRALKKILALKERGSEILLVCGDCTNEMDMVRAIDEVRENFGGIDGVVHAAGAASPQLIFQMDTETTEDIFAAKVKGALILERLLDVSALDFLIHFSSIASVDPQPGQTAYCSANAILDALAIRRTASTGSRICAISWGGWDEVGMMMGKRSELKNVKRSSEERVADDYGELIPLQQGLDTFQEILLDPSGPAHLVYTPRNILCATDLLDGAGLVSEDSKGSERTVSVEYRAPSNENEEALVEIWRKVLGIETIGVDDDYLDLGGDSITAIQLLTRIRTRLGVRLGLSSVFNSPTVAELAKEIKENAVEAS